MSEPATPRHVAIVGASLAGSRTAAALRTLGFTGELTVIGDERHVPYDRPPLSKDVLVDEGEPMLPVLPSGLDAMGAATRLGCAATGLDLRRRRVDLADGTSVEADAVVVATGAQPRRLAVGPELEGVHHLRTWEDALGIRESFRRGARVVVVGAGFIGGEVAAAARRYGLEVTIVEFGSAPFSTGVGPQVGELLREIHIDHGVRVLSGVAVVHVIGAERVEQVLLSDGRTLDVDLLVVGIGVVPSTAWLASSGLDLQDGVRCDAVGAACDAPGVFAVGDVASWWDPRRSRHSRDQHWTAATEQATTAARAILGEARGDEPAPVPYFWSDQYQHKIQMVGVYREDATVELAQGRPADRKFVVTFRVGDVLVGAVGVDSGRAIAEYRQLLKRSREIATP
ncbi:Ferredoxin--NAD(+) reductase (plasmid) [Pseudonocardia dioxanivorans CB1190]|uniref:Ferredoxin--NAD(+) reductase n=1 Tax=Pseudonocardia dioxanivorans (strain ATCC 55486 / DSM 44775 / JCM 13855 / CB1190) TaxID=675635 RepID=F2L737_PSEUX|nr:FAD-dependent oxidoreductase [Pseudonocardia dioxanivorans]AEA29010.1 Ferredoxin--NAD(+) reductase [Pseudonocardia dioxanivorans CB1190]